MLIGKVAMEKLSSSRVALFGVGGVGAAVAEGLARGGVGAIDLIDNDTVSVTNINRQLCALDSTVGMPKVEAVASRLLDINPNLKLTKRQIFFLPDTELDFSSYDYIVDAIDTVSAKIEIAVRAKECGIPLISCMGTGNRLDPTKFKVIDISKTEGCPLARVMRYELRKRGIKSLPVVFSSEPAARRTSVSPDNKTIGSISFVPSCAGLIAAGYVIRRLLGLQEH